jgi:Zn-dependent protease/predicted transcriptional regulator
MPQYVPDLSQIDYWLLGIISTVLLFFSVLLHELSHSLMSQRYGIPVRSITLFIFGGVSDISKEPKSAHKEFSIAIVGPITSFLISGIFAVLFFFFYGFEFPSIENVHLTKTEAVMFYGMIINLLLGIFNMIPAFPLDGGRILRSVLVITTGDFVKATKIATTVGIVFSYLLMGFGVIALFSGNAIGGIWILVIGWFLNNGVKSYKYYFELQHLLENVKAKDVMKTPIVTIKSSFSIEEALDYFRMHLKSELPVVDDDILLGMLTNKEALKIEEEQRSKVNVKDIMMPKNNLIIFSPDTKMDNALMQMVKKRQGKVFICDKQDRLLGIISKTDVLAIASERQDYFKHVTKSK